MSLLSEFVVSACILDSEQPANKRAVIQQLLHGLADAGRIARTDVEVALENLLRRESLGTTGTGNGIAIPHARHAPLQRSIAIMGLCRPPIDFDSLDGEPVDIVILILGPSDADGRGRRESLRKSESLMRRLQNEDFCNQLRYATSASDLLNQFLHGNAELT